MSDYISSTVNRRESGVEIESGIKLHKELFEPFERAAAGDRATKHSSDNINQSKIRFKRARSDAEAGWTSSAETAIKKRKHGTETEMTLRVPCPFYINWTQRRIRVRYRAFTKGFQRLRSSSNIS